MRAVLALLMELQGWQRSAKDANRSSDQALGSQQACGSTGAAMKINTAETVGRTERMTWADRAQFAGLASVGAGAIHLTAAGIHAEHPSLARILVILGVAQVVAGLVLALGGGRPAASVVAVVNIAAVGGWALTRTVGISWVQGLEGSERPQFADTVCVALSAIALVLAVVVLLRGARQAPRIGLVAPGALVGVVSAAAMLTGATHVHSHDAAGHVRDETAAAATPGADAGHGYAVDPSTWPRPFDPTQPIDFAGVPGVSPKQQARAETLVASTLRDLPQFADVTKVRALGFTSIGDADSGFEHYINLAYSFDDAFLDPNKPESLVYQVDGDKRTLVAAMFSARGMSLTDPKLVGWGGPLMQWHVHDDLCWSLDADRPVVVGSKDAAGKCPAGSINAFGAIPMVHVWITPNECGPFAALEGQSAGHVAGDGPRVDQCAAHLHSGGG
jgi:hypothetical protein